MKREREMKPVRSGYADVNSIRRSFIDYGLMVIFVTFHRMADPR